MKSQQSLAKTLFISLLLSVAIPSGVQADSSTPSYNTGALGAGIRVVAITPGVLLITLANTNSLGKSAVSGVVAAGIAAALEAEEVIAAGTGAILGAALGAGTIEGTGIRASAAKGVDAIVLASGLVVGAAVGAVVGVVVETARKRKKTEKLLSMKKER